MWLPVYHRGGQLLVLIRKIGFFRINLVRTIYTGSHITLLSLSSLHHSKLVDMVKGSAFTPGHANNKDTDILISGTNLL